MRIALRVSIVLIAAVVSACSDTPLTTAPPQPPAAVTPRPTPTPRPGGSLTGTVTDNTGHGVYGARVQILDGPDAGRFDVADSGQGDGEPVLYEMFGLTPGFVTVRASCAICLDETKTTTILEREGVVLNFRLTRR